MGGGIILINVATIKGAGRILANGSNGEVGIAGERPDGAGGGGAGGTVFIKVSNPDPSASLLIEAKGGNGGNTARDPGTEEHGPGGGGGGGLIFYSEASGTVTANVNEGRAGETDSGNGTTHGAEGGRPGRIVEFSINDLPAYLQGGGINCYPQLTTVMYESNPASPKLPGSSIEYTIETVNFNGGGNAGGVQIQAMLHPGMTFGSVSASYTGAAAGPEVLNNISSTSGILTFGDFNIPTGDTVQIKITATINCGLLPATYHASAQAIYLDPSRTIADRERRITPVLNAFSNSKINYETGDQGLVLGKNYDGTLPAAILENVILTETPPITNNTISIPDSSLPNCDSTDPPLLSGSIAEGGNGIQYQWQNSEDEANFTDIPDATGKDYDPLVVRKTNFYRRKAISVCVPEHYSNIIRVNVYYSPKADFEVPEICLDDATAEFTNKSLNSDSTETGLTYRWDFGDSNANAGNPNTSTEKNGRHMYSAAGIYTVELITTTSDGCSDTLQKQFRVNGSTPKAGFEVINDDALCSNYVVQFRDTASVDFGEITKIEWYFDLENKPDEIEVDENPVLRSAEDHVYTHDYGRFTSPASKQFMVRMVAYSGGVCLDDIVIPITVHAVPEVEFGSIPPACFSSSPFLLNQGTEKNGVLQGSGITKLYNIITA